MKEPLCEIFDVNEQNISEIGIFCIKDKKSPGYIAKLDWFKSQFELGLRMKIAINNMGKQLGFIEYVPIENAWRPVKGKGYYFIQCIAVFVKDAKESGVGSMLIKSCENDAKAEGKTGICAMASEGVWMANKKIYLNNEYEVVDKLGRFELLHKSLKKNLEPPQFIDWSIAQTKYVGWNLVYSNQCPWHDKSINDLSLSAKEHGIKLKVTKIMNAKEAQLAPSGFGTFSLIKDGRLLEDHYLSKTRFENILKKELSTN